MSAPGRRRPDHTVVVISHYFDHHGDVPYLRPTSSAQALVAARTFPLDDYEYRAPATTRRTA